MKQTSLFLAILLLLTPIAITMETNDELALPEETTDDLLIEDESPTEEILNEEPEDELLLEDELSETTDEVDELEEPTPPKQPQSEPVDDLPLEEESEEATEKLLVEDEATTSLTEEPTDELLIEDEPAEETDELLIEEEPVEESDELLLEDEPTEAPDELDELTEPLEEPKELEEPLEDEPLDEFEETTDEEIQTEDESVDDESSDIVELPKISTTEMILKANHQANMTWYNTLEGMTSNPVMLAVVDQERTKEEENHEALMQAEEERQEREADMLEEQREKLAKMNLTKEERQKKEDETRNKALDITLRSPKLQKVLLTTLKTKKRVDAVIKRIRLIVKDARKGIIRIPKYGMFKLNQFKGKLDTYQTKFWGETVPQLVGTFYNLAGKKINNIQVGPFKINLTKLYLLSQDIPPLFDCSVNILGHVGRLIQEKIEADVPKFVLSFKKPFMLPIGLAKKIPLDQFKLSLENQTLSTQTKIYNIKNELPSDIVLYFGESPLNIKVKSKNIPLSIFSDRIKTTPLKNLILKNLLFTIIPNPLSVSATGVADMKTIDIGIDTKKTKATLTAKLGIGGFAIVFDMENLKLPGNLGTIQDARMRIGTSR